MNQYHVFSTRLQVDAQGKASDWLSQINQWERYIIKKLNINLFNLLKLSLIVAKTKLSLSDDLKTRKYFLMKRKPKY